MILIADSGSTKTAWMEVESGNMIVTEGLNPHFTDDETFLSACHQVSQQLLDNAIDADPFSVFFYGAGCGSATQRQRVETLLSAAFCTGSVFVETDMLGACRAASGERESLVAILGTGSNACYYDGSVIRCQPTSTGYVLGDNGSANHVGRILLNDYLTERMPAEVRDRFYDTYRMSKDQLIDAVYHRPTPNRFLASLAPFAVQYMNEDYCRGVVDEALYNWYHGPLETLREQSGYNEGEINLVGGFAKAIESAICHCLEGDTLRVGTILADPVVGLCRYHQNH